MTLLYKLTIARPDNTTAYSAGDVIGVADSGTPANAGSAVLAFTPAGVVTDKDLIVVGTSLQINVAAVPSGMTSFRLYLYSTAPTAILDNAAWDALASAEDQSGYIGYIDLGTPAVFGGNVLFVQTAGVNQPVYIPSNTQTVYGKLVTNGGYTPAALTRHVVSLFAI